MRKKLIITLAGSIAVLTAAAAIVRSIEIRAYESQQHCVDILRTIDGCKQQWAVERKASPDATPTWDDLRDYIKGATPPPWAHCPSGGTYSIGRIRALPSCSIASHQHAFEATTRAANQHLQPTPAMTALFPAAGR